jgi:hypothetical protein
MAIDLSGGSSEGCCDAGGAQAGAAPAGAQYWLGAASGSLPNAHNLGALATGLVKNTAGTPSIAVADTDYTSPAGLATALAGYVPTTRQVIAGAGLTGGGTLAADRTLNVVAADGTITVNADSIQVGEIANANVAAAAAIAHTKLANLAGASVLGRAANSTGAMAAITGATPGHVLTVQGDNTLAFSAAPATGYATIERPNGTPVTQRQIMSFTTEFTVADNTDTTDISLATAGVGLAKIELIDPLSVLGNRTNSGPASPDDSIQTTAGSNGVLRENASQINFGLLIDANIDAGAGVQHSKLAYGATGVLGRASTGSGALGMIGSSGTPGHVLTVQGDGTLAFSAGGTSGYTTIENPNGTPVTARSIVAFSSEFLAADATDTTNISLATAGVAFSKIADLAAVSVLGRSAGTSGVMAAITASGNDEVLRRTGGGSLAFGTLVNAHIDAAAAIAFSKLATIAGLSVLGVTAGSTTTVAAITAAADGDVLTRVSSSSLAFGKIGGGSHTGYTQHRVVLGSSTGGLTDSAGLTFNSTTGVLAQSVSSASAVSHDVTNTSTGDAQINLTSGGTTYALGVDNSVSGDPLTLSVGSALGTTNILTYTSGFTNVGLGAPVGGESAEATVTVGRNNGSTYSISEIYNDQATRRSELRLYHSNSGVRLQLLATGGSHGGTTFGGTDSSRVTITSTGLMKVGTVSGHDMWLGTQNALRMEFTSGGNIGLFALGSYGGGVGVLSMANATTAPTSNPTGGGVEYWESGVRKLLDPTGMIVSLN